MKSQSKIAASSAETSDVQSNEFQDVQSENGVGAITYFCVKTDNPSSTPNDASY